MLEVIASFFPVSDTSSLCFVSSFFSFDLALCRHWGGFWKSVGVPTGSEKTSNKLRVSQKKDQTSCVTRVGNDHTASPKYNHESFESMEAMYLCCFFFFFLSEMYVAAVTEPFFLFFLVNTMGWFREA